MKKMKYYEETSALLHEFSEENQQYFEELWDSFLILLDFSMMRTISESRFI